MFKALVSAIFATTLLASASPSFASHKDVFDIAEYPIGYVAEEQKKESGEKGGTADMNIGVGELQECTNAAGASPTDLKRGTACAKTKR